MAKFIWVDPITSWLYISLFIKWSVQSRSPWLIWSYSALIFVSLKIRYITYSYWWWHCIPNAIPVGLHRGGTKGFTVEWIFDIPMELSLKQYEVIIGTARGLSFYVTISPYLWILFLEEAWFLWKHSKTHHCFEFLNMHFLNYWNSEMLFSDNWLEQWLSVECNFYWYL